MTKQLGVVMDPIESITPYKDTTLALLLEAQRHGYALVYMTLDDLFVRDGIARAQARRLTVADDNDAWFEYRGASETIDLGDLDVILMRKDPPFDMEYIYATYILERAEAAGTRVVNQPAALRDVNEKMAITRFPELCTPTLISRSAEQFKAFVAEQNDVIVKPLDGMGGSRIFRVHAGDPNLSVVIEVLTDNGQRFAMAQTFEPAIASGDKRILVIDGQPIDYALARVPAEGELRGNLAAGGRGVARELTTADRQIAETVGPFLVERGITFAGLDVIGDKLTEINVTSPTCVREIEEQREINIASTLFHALERHFE
ncbi:glutathione synthase [Salinisphaera sp. USBA-960]|nr:glutathione synthase [Salifodinibacter halophilus]NNC26464.1 glutathione synthase [Salifodinibacter halophilus]